MLIDSTQQNHQNSHNFILGSNRGNFQTKTTSNIHFSTVQSTSTNIKPILSTRKLPPKSCHFSSFLFSLESSKNGKYYWQITSHFKASCKDSKELQERWTLKKAKNISRTRHVWPWSVDVITNASKVFWDTFYTLMWVTLSCGEWQFMVWENVGNTARLPCSFMSDLDDFNFSATV
jgi:hypothetical protein